MRHRKRTEWGEFRGANSYEDQIGEFAQNVDLNIVLEFLRGAKGTIIDLPCGAGRMSRALAAVVDGRLISADYSPGMLAVARRRVTNPVLRCDAFVLPFRGASIDRIVMLRLAFHYADLRLLLEEATRALRSGGEIVFDTLNPLSMRHLVEWLLRLLGRRQGKTGLFFHAPHEVNAIARSLGLEVMAVESRFVMPTRLYRRLPAAMLGFLKATERLVPPSQRVLTYWRLVKR